MHERCLHQTAAPPPNSSLPPHRYDFDTVHPVAKGGALSVDNFAYGYEPLGMLLWFGNVEAARAGFAKVLDAHKRILARVRQGEATADGCVQVLPVLFA